MGLKRYLIEHTEIMTDHKSSNSVLYRSITIQSLLPLFSVEIERKLSWQIEGGEGCVLSFFYRYYLIGISVVFHNDGVETAPTQRHRSC